MPQQYLCRIIPFIFIGAALLLIAALFTTAQADYLGPNRVIVTYETQYHRVRCNYVAVSDPPGSGPTPDYCGCNYTVFVGYGGSCPGIDLGY